MPRADVCGTIHSSDERRSQRIQLIQLIHRIRRIRPRIKA
jgi:hypothetical protein